MRGECGERLRVLLIGSDSSIPNLALMKISAYHKSKGDEVGFKIRDPDLIYISRIFKRGSHNSTIYPGVKVIQGGPGYDESIRLPPEIEQTPPDPNLYQSKFSIARITSGCPRRCHFCMVHKLEPLGIRYIMPPGPQWKTGTVLRLLDDNILAMPEAFWEVHRFSTENKIKIHFEYLDIRLVTPKIAKGLKEIYHYDYLYFAWDYTHDETKIFKGFETLKEAGVNIHRTIFLLYCEDIDMLQDVRYRFEIVRDQMGALPFIMVNMDNKNKVLARIGRKGCNKKSIRKMTIDQIFDPSLTIEQWKKTKS